MQKKGYEKIIEEWKQYYLQNYFQPMYDELDKKEEDRIFNIKKKKAEREQDKAERQKMLSKGNKERKKMLADRLKLNQKQKIY